MELFLLREDEDHAHSLGKVSLESHPLSALVSVANSKTLVFLWLSEMFLVLDGFSWQLRARIPVV